MRIYGFKRKLFETPLKRSMLAVLIVTNFLVLALLLSKDMLGLMEVNLNQELRIEIVNVGQGDCAIIRTPKGRTFLVDGGTNVSKKEARQLGRERIQDYLKKIGIDKIDCILVTHWHIDDFSGLIPVIKEFKVDTVFETANLFRNDFYDEFDDLCKRKRIKRITVKSGNKLELGDEVFVQVLNPEDSFASSNHSEMNDDSVVLLIRYGKVQTLMCADIGEDAEREIVKFNDSLRSQIIKIPDHGSERSLYRPFYKLVKPMVGVISVGANNPFGFPSEKSIEFFEETGIKLYRTDLNGNVHLFIGGKDEKDFRIYVDRKL